MPIYRVWLTDRNPHTGQSEFMNFECACETLLDFVERLERGDLIVGERLRTRRTEKDRVLRVVERVQCALSREGSLGGGRVAQIEEPCVEFVE